ncbi:MAG: hypothetical protein CMI30_06975 [Opitutae bacterium]|nr:hypothetical protein [Opitutae bacterium]|tara:strand:+ start:980 stop:2155 length:1176 start_codon:yes stop_codon:yes gene_type:complete
MKRSAFSSLLLLLLTLGFLPCSLAGRVVANKPEGGATLSQIRLASIVAKERRLLALASEEKPMNEKELTRKIQDLVTDYESYLADNPKDVTALLLFGKFLRQVDQPGPATGIFLKADKIDSNLAVVKQQIANYLAEEGRVAEALPYLLRAVELSPKVATYHHQLGTFLFLFQEELIDLGITTKSSNDRNMMIAFRQAATLEPDNFEYRLRYAQSFFDVAKPDWNEALNLWRELASKSKSKVVEMEYLFLCQARVLMELDRPLEARRIIDRVHSPAMKATKSKLLELLVAPQASPPAVKPTPSKQKPSVKDKNAQINLRPNDKAQPSDEELFFDADLMKLAKIVERLEEEKLLRNLRVDAVRASYDDKGRIKMSLQALAELNRVGEQPSRNF